MSRNQSIQDITDQSKDSSSYSEWDGKLWKSQSEGMTRLDLNFEMLLLVMYRKYNEDRVERATEKATKFNPVKDDDGSDYSQWWGSGKKWSNLWISFKVEPAGFFVDNSDMDYKTE